MYNFREVIIPVYTSTVLPQMESALLSRRSQEIIKGKTYIVLTMYLTCINLLNSIILRGRYYYYPHYAQEDWSTDRVKT